MMLLGILAEAMAMGMLRRRYARTRRRHDVIHVVGLELDGKRRRRRSRGRLRGERTLAFRRHLARCGK